MNHGILPTLRTKQIKARKGFQSRFGHAHRAGVHFGDTVVDLVTALPDTVIGRAIRAADVVDQILNKADFVQGVDDFQTRSGHLSQH